MESFRHRLRIQKRRRMQRRTDIPQAFWRSPSLQSFSNLQISSLILIRGSFRSRLSLRDAAVIVTEELQQRNTPVLWAVRTGKEDSPLHRVSPMQVVKSLVAQALCLNSSSQLEKPMASSCARLQTASTDAEWFQLLGSALEALQREVYIMLDLDLLDWPSEEELIEAEIFSPFFNLFQELSSRGLGKTVKVMVFTYRQCSPQNVPREGFMNAYLSARPMARPTHCVRQPTYMRKRGETSQLRGRYQWGKKSN